MAVSKVDAANQIENQLPNANLATIATTKLGAGAVLQVASATDSSNISTTSTSFVTGSNTMTVNLTPSSSSNKVLVLLNSNIQMTSNNTGAVTVYRDTTNLGSSFGFGVSYATVNMSSGMSACYLDSPSTTSQVTYQVYFRSFTGGTVNLNGSGSTGNLTVIEIAG